MLAQTWGCGRKAPADLILTNCTIYTVNERQPLAEAVAIKRGHILWTGSKEGIQAYVGRMTRVLDLHGNTAFPGFTDSHYHLSGVGSRELTLNLERTTTLEEFLSKVKLRVDRAKEGEWVVGRGWI